MNKFVIKVNRKKLYLCSSFEFNGTIIPVFDDELDLALIFDKKEGEKLVNKLSKNFNNLILQQIND